MITDEQMREIFEKYNTIAVYGMSRFKHKAAQGVPAFMLSRGYNIIPINPFADIILGQKCYPDLKDIPDKIEILNVFRPSYYVFEVVKDVLSRKNEKGDIDVIWLQEGIMNEDARKLAEEAGIIFLQDLCMFKEFIRLYPANYEK
jgi:predicted CoA-binding protein